MGNSKFNHVKITGIQGVIPPKVINIDDEIEFYENDPQKLERNKKILGLGTRHVVEEGITAVDLCEQAANSLIEKLGIDKNEIDTLIMATCCPDYSGPASSCILQGRLGLSEDCDCFDMSGLACSMYVHALWVAHSLVASGASKKCLLLCGDTNSYHADIKNRNTVMLYGDAGTATLLEYTEEENTAYFTMGTKGECWDKIIAPATGHRLPVREDIAGLKIVDKNGYEVRLWDDCLEGMDVFNFSMNYAPKSVNDVLAYSGKTMDDIDFVAMHQANGQIVRMVAKHSDIPKGKYSIESFRKYANSGAAAIAVNVCDCCSQKDVKNLMLVSFGVGLSWGTAIVDFGSTKNFGMETFINPDHIPTRQELIEYWIKKLKGEYDA